MFWDKKVRKQQIYRVLANKYQGGFLDAYFKILTIMDKNKTSTNPKHEAITGLWAFKIMKQKEQFIIKQFNGLFQRKFKKELMKTMSGLIINLQDKHQEVRLQICKNIASKSNLKYVKAKCKVTGEELLVTLIKPDITYDGWKYNCWTPDGIRYNEDELIFIDKEI